MQFVMNQLNNARRLARKLGPYLIVELLLPGGTLLALLLFVCRDGRVDTAGIAARIGLAVAKALKGGLLSLRPLVRWPVHAYHPAGRAIYEGPCSRR